MFPAATDGPQAQKDSLATFVSENHDAFGPSLSWRPAWKEEDHPRRTGNFHTRLLPQPMHASSRTALGPPAPASIGGLAPESVRSVECVARISGAVLIAFRRTKGRSSGRSLVRHKRAARSRGWLRKMFLAHGRSRCLEESGCRVRPGLGFTGAALLTCAAFGLHASMSAWEGWAVTATPANVPNRENAEVGMSCSAPTYGLRGEPCAGPDARHFLRKKQPT